jgi:hypothetical protein
MQVPPPDAPRPKAPPPPPPAVKARDYPSGAVLVPAPWPTASTTPEQQAQAGKMWALLSYAGIFVGIPLSILPLVKRDNAYALYHAKHATAAYIASVVLFVIWIVIYAVSCGFGWLAFPLVLLPWAPAVHGIMLVNKAAWREPWGLFGLGDRLFGTLELKAPSS